MATVDTIKKQNLQHGRTKRKMREALLAYALVAPAFVITAIFGLYPVVFGLWESLKQGRPIANTYVGLDNYTQGIGSLIYVLIIFVSFAFFMLSFKAWKRIRGVQAQHPADKPVWLLLPGFLVGLGVIMLMVVLIIGGVSYPLFDEPITLGLFWLPLFIIVAGAVGYISLRHRYMADYSFYVMNTILMMTLTLIGILALRYSYSQLITDVQDARDVAMAILNNEVGNARPFVENEEVILVNAGVDGEIPLTAAIGENTFDVTVAPTDLEQIQFDELEGEATIVYSNNERVRVTVSINRGFGLGPSSFETEGQVQIEGGGILSGGNDDVTASILINEDTSVLVPFDIYVTADVGQDIIQRGGYTLPVENALRGVIGFLVAIAVAVYSTHQINRIPENQQARLKLALLIIRVVSAIAAIGLLTVVATSIIFYRQGAEALSSLTQEQFNQAYLLVYGSTPGATVTPDGLAADMLILPQALMVCAGALLIYLAYLVWTNARHRETPLGMMGSLFIASALMVGGWMLLSELPATFTVAGQEAIEVRNSLVRTATFSIGTVPPQLMIGILLAYLLFYEIGIGKGLFRLIYFMPYITPQVATAAIFTVIFSLEATGLANQFLGLVGIDELLWLKESKGLTQVIYEILGGDPNHVPRILEGPSLALTTVILFNVWVYAGYNAVIFLAGLGAIPGELYEAAKVDGAGRWAAFRHITFPLLSPVTFFLSMLSIIGTFRAFGSVAVLGRTAIGEEVDTLTVKMFNELYRANNPGYAASLAFILFAVIVMLTITQNQLAKDRVFYG
ncbi:MAG: ABC transporter permease subunit [Chloroflexi bacterium]|nr:ABC transporter permease subunit [Chloroflexota bacterium]